MHNFVLACSKCNRSKSDTLAALVHLDRWIQLITKNLDPIKGIGDKAGISNNFKTSLAIARWGYSSEITLNSALWMKSSVYEKPLAVELESIWSKYV
jgi:hypothetical protein